MGKWTLYGQVARGNAVLRVDAFETEIVDQPLWYRVLYFYVSIPGHRIKYYFDWVLGH